MVSSPLLDSPINLRGAYTSEGYRADRAATKEGRTAPTGGAPRFEKVSRQRLIDQSRDFRRNNPIYQGMIVRPRQFIVGTGFKLQLVPAPGQAPAVKEWCQAVEKAWRSWWECPDVRGILSGPRIEALVTDEVLTCGDTGVILVDDPEAGPKPSDPTQERERLALQVIEAEQIADPKAATSDGITRDKFGRPTAFWVQAYNDNGHLDSRKARSYSPSEFLFICDQPERASSLRCVPGNQSGFPNLHRLNDIADSVALTWQTRSRFALQINRNVNVGPSTISKSDPTTDETDVDGVASQGRVTDLGYALIFHGTVGEEIKGIANAGPDQSFREVFRALLQLNGLPMSLPLEFMLLDFTADNYSQTRALVAMFGEWIVERQHGLMSQFHRPLFDWWLRKRIEAKKIPPPPGEFERTWIPPVFPGIDLEAETRAWADQMRLGLRSWSEAVKAQNGDPDETRAKIASDWVEAIKAAGQVKSETGVDVPWQPFAGMPAPAAPAAAKPPTSPGPGQGGKRDEDGKPVPPSKDKDRPSQPPAPEPDEDEGGDE